MLACTNTVWIADQQQQQHKKVTATCMLVCWYASRPGDAMTITTIITGNTKAQSISK